MNKKIVLLGGSQQQVVAIDTAKKLGYYTILCDYLPDNPGKDVAHEFFQISTTDKQAVLDIAKQKRVDGIIAYASDPAAPTAAYVAESLGLPGNPYRAIDILTDKGKFRDFLKANGFSTPDAQVFSSYAELTEKININAPMMMKPVDSCGSKGVFFIEDKRLLSKRLFEETLSFSRCKQVIIEEFIEDNGYQVAGDGFSVDGELVFYCFGNDHFNKDAPNPFVPVSASFPYHRPELECKIKSEIQRLLSLLNMRTCAYNFDIKVGKDDKIYLMEIGPRNGGNYIPQIINYMTGVDMVELSLKAAMGETLDSIKTKNKSSNYYAYYSIHTNKSGILKDISMSKNIQRHIVANYITKKHGETVEAYTRSNTSLGIVLLNFESLQEMLFNIENIQEEIKVLVST